VTPVEVGNFELANDGKWNPTEEFEVMDGSMILPPNEIYTLVG
jgi:hypothetical protein